MLVVVEAVAEVLFLLEALEVVGMAHHTTQTMVLLVRQTRAVEEAEA
jgi:hypothetical protein